MSQGAHFRHTKELYSGKINGCEVNQLARRANLALDDIEPTYTNITYSEYNGDTSLEVDLEEYDHCIRFEEEDDEWEDVYSWAGRLSEKE